MPTNKTNIDTSVLPLDVLSLMDNKFYDLIRELTSSNEAALLELQQINNVNAFILTENPLELMNLNSRDINDIKKQICFELADKAYVVKPGIRSNLQYLTDLFNKKIEENVKEKQKAKALKPTHEKVAIDDPKDIKTSILRSIKRWCEENEENFNL